MDCQVEFVLNVLVDIHLLEEQIHANNVQQEHMQLLVHRLVQNVLPEQLQQLENQNVQNVQQVILQKKELQHVLLVHQPVLTVFVSKQLDYVKVVKVDMVILMVFVLHVLLVMHRLERKIHVRNVLLVIIQQQ